MNADDEMKKNENQRNFFGIVEYFVVNEFEKSCMKNGSKIAQV